MTSSEPMEDEIEFPGLFRSLRVDWPQGHEEKWHFHNGGQLLFASEGVMNVTTEDGLYAVPPERAVWLPPSKTHKVSATTPLSVRTVYINPTVASSMGEECVVLPVRPLLKELILESMTISAEYKINTRDEKLIELLIDELRNAMRNSLDLYLPRPKDRRVQKIVNSVFRNPANHMTAEDWAQLVGASSRTIDRIFRAETSMSFDRWRRQAALIEAIKLLEDGCSVTDVATRIGYDSPSAFISMFKRAIGTTPGKLFE